MRFSAGSGISVGFLMIAQWTFSILSGDVPEFGTAPWAIGFHLAVELSTALMLIVGGIGTMKSTGWGKPILLVGGDGYLQRACQSWLFCSTGSMRAGGNVCSFAYRRNCQLYFAFVGK